jgi:hypothetical protein
MKLTMRFLALALGVFAVPAVGNAQVLDLGDGGSFANAINPSNVGRATGAFWDNASADQVTGVTNCNVGFFATGAMDAGCINQAAGTFANQGGYTNYWGKGVDGRDPAAFMFSGTYSYQLKLVGSIAGGTSEVGWFTIAAGGGYVFNPIASFGAKIVNSTYAIGGGADWGLYIRNTFNSATGGCLSSDYDCSDATGGYTGAPFQQFVLMMGRTPGTYLAGIEDNQLNVGPNGSFHDSDYQDYLIEITTTAAPEPLSMVLMATGLVGMAGAGMIRRRRERNKA